MHGSLVESFMPSLTIRHLTTYRYRRAVAFGEHRMMLHPRDSHDQRVIQVALKISPEPTSLRFVQDAFGNHVGIARFSRRSNELSFESVVRVEHSPRDGFGLEDAGRPFRVNYSIHELRDLAPYLERHQLDPIDEVCRWARQLLRPGGAIGALELLTRLSQAIHKGFLYRRREEKGVQSPIETLRLGHGSCRDFAMLMIDAARSFGLAARFASGYLAVPLEDPQEPTSSSGRGSTHAWAQIYLPGAGWIDFDPTSGSVGNVDLVTVAVVPDPRHAIPLHGTYVGFPSDHLGMEVQVSVMFDSPKGDLDGSATDRISTIGPMRAPRQNHRAPVGLRGYPELETGAKRSQPAPPAEGGA
jgi:transglutaminase-like putative cysteine protease